MIKKTCALWACLLLASVSFAQHRTHSVRNGEAKKPHRETSENRREKRSASRKSRVEKDSAPTKSKRSGKSENRSGSGLKAGAADNDVTIAKRLGVKVSALRKANPEINWNKLRPGAIVKAPGDSAKAPANEARSSQSKPKVSASMSASRAVAKVSPTKQMAKATGPAVSLTAVGTRLAKIATDDVTLRKGPSTSNSRVAMMKKGHVGKIVDRHDDWVQVKFPSGTLGWVRSDFVTTTTVGGGSTPAPKGAVAMSTPKAAEVTPVDTPAEKLAVVAPKPAPAPKAVPKSVPAVRGDILSTASSFLGVRYVYGGTSRSGIDCSAFVGAVYRQHGIFLPRTAAEQSSRGYAVSIGELRKGDLLFFRTGRSSRINHVGMYIGDGKMIHASSGSGRVLIVSFYGSYYQRCFAFARRVASGISGSIDESFSARPQPSRNSRNGVKGAVDEASVDGSNDPEPDDSPRKATNGTDEIGS